MPIGWGEDTDVSLVDAGLILVGIPLLLFVLITIAVYLPSVLRGESIAPGSAEVEDQWLGGPRTGTAQLGGADSADTGDAADAGTGGASGRW
jgi:hypothetical protein